jgi:hypothetical protein
VRGESELAGTTDENGRGGDESSDAGRESESGDGTETGGRDERGDGAENGN